MTDELDGGPAYRVVVNDEGQHAIWWADRSMPDGWTATGDVGSRDACLARISEVWTDITPLSVRRRLDRETV